VQVCRRRDGAILGHLRPSNRLPYERKDPQVDVGPLGTRLGFLVAGIAAPFRPCGAGEGGELGGPPRCEGGLVRGPDCLSVD
jgi:hypothetical protein